MAIEITPVTIATQRGRCPFSAMTTTFGVV